MVHNHGYYGTKSGPMWILISAKATTEKEGPKHFPAAPFFEYFFSATTCKKYSKNSAAGNFFGPSHFDPVLDEVGM